MLTVPNKFTFSFLTFKVPFRPSFLGIPRFKLKFPLKPSRFCFFSIIFKIPAVPSADYLADGDVTTSTFSIDSEGRDLKP